MKRSYSIAFLLGILEENAHAAFSISQNNKLTTFTTHSHTHTHTTQPHPRQPQHPARHHHVLAFSKDFAEIPFFATTEEPIHCQEKNAVPPKKMTISDPAKAFFLEALEEEEEEEQYHHHHPHPPCRPPPSTAIFHHYSPRKENILRFERERMDKDYLYQARNNLVAGANSVMSFLQTKPSPLRRFSKANDYENDNSILEDMWDFMLMRRPTSGGTANTNNNGRASAKSSRTTASSSSDTLTKEDIFVRGSILLEEEPEQIKEKGATTVLTRTSTTTNNNDKNNNDKNGKSSNESKENASPPITATTDTTTTTADSKKISTRMETTILNDETTNEPVITYISAKLGKVPQNTDSTMSDNNNDDTIVLETKRTTTTTTTTSNNLDDNNMNQIKEIPVKIPNGNSDNNNDTIAMEKQISDKMEQNPLVNDEIVNDGLEEEVVLEVKMKNVTAGDAAIPTIQEEKEPRKKEVKMRMKEKEKGESLIRNKNDLRGNAMEKTINAPMSSDDSTTNIKVNGNKINQDDILSKEGTNDVVADSTASMKVKDEAEGKEIMKENEQTKEKIIVLKDEKDLIIGDNTLSEEKENVNKNIVGVDVDVNVDISTTNKLEDKSRMWNVRKSNKDSIKDEAEKDNAMIIEDEKVMTNLEESTNVDVETKETFDKITVVKDINITMVEEKDIAIAQKNTTIESKKVIEKESKEISASEDENKISACAVANTEESLTIDDKNIASVDSEAIKGVKEKMIEEDVISEDKSINIVEETSISKNENNVTATAVEVENKGLDEVVTSLNDIIILEDNKKVTSVDSDTTLIENIADEVKDVDIVKQSVIADEKKSMTITSGNEEIIGEESSTLEVENNPAVSAISKDRVKTKDTNVVDIVVADSIIVEIEDEEILEKKTVSKAEKNITITDNVDTQIDDIIAVLKSEQIIPTTDSNDTEEIIRNAMKESRVIEVAERANTIGDVQKNNTGNDDIIVEQQNKTVKMDKTAFIVKDRNYDIKEKKKNMTTCIDSVETEVESKKIIKDSIIVGEKNITTTDDATVEKEVQALETNKPAFIGKYFIKEDESLTVDKKKNIAIVDDTAIQKESETVQKDETAFVAKGDTFFMEEKIKEKEAVYNALRKSRYAIRVEKFARLPVWPAWNGVAIFLLSKLFGNEVAAEFEDKVGGRVCPNFFTPEKTSPFIMLVHHRHSFAPWDPFRYIQKSFFPEGFPSHPHRGFTTVTYCLKGGMIHRDSMGEKQIYGAEKRHKGKHTQWLTAGAGLLHEEMWDIQPDSNEMYGDEDGNNIFRRIFQPSSQELYQLWLNLPASKKMDSPSIELLGGEDSTPSVINEETDESDSTKRLQTKTIIISGEHAGKKASIETASGVSILHVQMDPGSTWTHSMPLTHRTAILYMRTGSVTMNGLNDTNAITEITIDPHYTAYLSSKGEKLTIHCPKTQKGKADFLLLTGDPIYEPVFAQGSMVMNYPDEINTAYSDYQQGKMGSPWDHKLTDEEWKDHNDKYPFFYRDSEHEVEESK